MFEDVINDIQDSIGRLHHEIEAKRKGFNDALDENQSPEQHGKELAKMQDEMKRLLDKGYRAFKVLTERL
jgi:archaellum component FlaC